MYITPFIVEENGAQKRNMTYINHEASKGYSQNVNFTQCVFKPYLQKSQDNVRQSFTFSLEIIREW